MSGHRHFDGAELDFGDPAFEPRSSFDFAEEANHLNHSMPSFNNFSEEDLDFSMMDDFDGERDEFEEDFFHGHSGHMDYHASGHGVRMSGPGGAVDMSKPSMAMNSFHSMPEAHSMQSRIVSKRGSQVSEHFGQITPPDEITEELFKVPPPKQSSRGQDPGKLSNEQRARNAANTRHSRPKTAKKKQQKEEDDESDAEGAQKQSKNINLQREKNRVAAAKCRAKKKSANEQQEEMANQFGTTNNLLTREIRDLKNQKTELQNYLLAHRPGVCECHGIHDYNLGQAHRLVLNARRQVAHGAPSSPSQDSVFSGQSSGSEATGMMFGRPSPLIASESMGMLSPPQSFNTPLELTFSQMTNAETTQGGQVTAKGGQRVPRELAEFLRNSPGGRAGFS